jgi:hypothetical protein
MNALATKGGFEYVSTLSVLCNLRGCRASSDPSRPEILLFVDDGHLSVEGSVWLAARIASVLFNENSDSR